MLYALHSSAPALVDQTTYAADRVNWNPSALPTVTTGAITTLAFTTSTITDSGSGFVAAGFLPCQYVTVTDSSGSNSGTFGPIHAVSAGTLTFAASTFTAESAGNSVTVLGGAPYTCLYSAWGNSGSPIYYALQDTLGNRYSTNGVTVTGTPTNGHLAVFDAAKDITDNGALFSAESIMTISLNGGGSAIATGSAGNKRFKQTWTINGYSILSDSSCSCSVDLWKTTYANYDGVTHPVVGDSIVASAPISLTTAYKNEDVTLTGWTKTIAVNDLIHANVTSCTCTGGVTIQVYGSRGF
jgi:hypothetical protein